MAIVAGCGRLGFGSGARDVDARPDTSEANGSDADDASAACTSMACDGL